LIFDVTGGSGGAHDRQTRGVRTPLVCLSCAPPDPPVTSKIKETKKINMYPERVTEHIEEQ